MVPWAVNGPPAHTLWAWYGAWVGEGHALNFSAPLGGSVRTNNWAELMAAIEVLGLVSKTTEIQLCVDPQLVADGATLWLEGCRETEAGKQKRDSQSKAWAYTTHHKSRTAEQEQVKGPSHVDPEGNEKG